MEYKINIIGEQKGYKIKVTYFTKNGTYITNSKIVFPSKSQAISIAKDLVKTFQETNVA